MGIEENKAVVERLFNEVWNGRHFDVIDELYAADYVADYRPYAHCGWDETRYVRWSTSVDDDPGLPRGTHRHDRRG